MPFSTTSIIYLFCLPLPTYRSTLSEQLFSFRNRNIRDIAARKVYPQSMLPLIVVGSYPTFSPFPIIATATTGSYFLRHFLSPILHQGPFVKWCEALRCPDFPLLLKVAIERHYVTKLTKKYLPISRHHIAVLTLFQSIQSHESLSNRSLIN